MKKKTKIILFCLIGALILVATGVGITLATIASRNSVSGIMVDGEEIVEGTYKYDWRKNEASISYGFTKDNPCDEKFYSNGKHSFNSSDDYITNIYFVEDDSYTSICYSCEFDVSSEMQVFFVFDNGYVTKISNVGSTTRVLGGTVNIDAEEINQLKAQGKDLTNAKIVEVWVKTLSGAHIPSDGIMVDGQYIFEGTGKNDWRKYEVDIANNVTDPNYYYTNETGDYIRNIKLYHQSYLVIVSYTNYFNIFNDFETVFVLSNMKEGSEEIQYIAHIETDHFPGNGSINIDYTELDPEFLNRSPKNYDIINSFHVIEVWIRTEH